MADKTSKAKDPQTLKVKPSELALALAHCISMKMPIFTWGPPGIGKSAIIKQVAAQLGMKSIDIRLSQMDPTDLRGVPYPANDATTKDIVDAVVAAASQAVQATMESIGSDGNAFEVAARVVAEAAAKAAAEYAGKPGMKWAPPAILPRNPDDRVVVFLDEMNTAPQSIQAAAYQLVLDRRLGEYTLPENCVVVAAGNRQTDNGATFKMPTPLMNRFVHLELEHSFDDWYEWAIETQQDRDVVAYLTFSKADLMQFDPRSSSRGFATPRSWEFVSKMKKHNQGRNLPIPILRTLYAGAIGDGLAIKFTEFSRRAAELPNPTDILHGKIKDLKNEDLSLYHSLTLGLCHELRDTFNAARVSGKDEEMEKWYSMVDNVITFWMKNFQPEMVVMGSRIALSTYRLPFQPDKLRSWKDYSERYQDLILKAFPLISRI
jgi:MoxR-like ATPase